MEKFFFVHQAICINDGDSVWIDAIDLGDEIYHILVGIRSYRYHLKKNQISFRLQKRGIFQGGIGFFLFENKADAVDERFLTWLDVIYVASSVVYHCNNHRITFVNVSENLHHRFCVRLDGPVFIKWATIIKETEFDNVYVCFTQTIKCCGNCVTAELPIVDVASVTESAIEQLYCAHE